VICVFCERKEETEGEIGEEMLAESNRRSGFLLSVRDRGLIL
jgi:hypothetical protein